MDSPPVEFALNRKTNAMVSIVVAIQHSFFRLLLKTLFSKKHLWSFNYFHLNNLMKTIVGTIPPITMFDIFKCPQIKNSSEPQMKKMG